MAATLDQYLNKRLEDPEFRREYEALELEFAVLEMLAEARKAQGLTQAELAKRSGVNQADISRIENGDINPTLSTLEKLAKACGKKVVLI